MGWEVWGCVVTLVLRPVPFNNCFDKQKSGDLGRPTSKNDIILLFGIWLCTQCGINQLRMHPPSCGHHMRKHEYLLATLYNPPPPPKKMNAVLSFIMEIVPQWLLLIAGAGTKCCPLAATAIFTTIFFFTSVPKGRDRVELGRPLLMFPVPYT
ncbi:hypothetical protein XENTR_v10013365 [Xenopus tropicalis]|nr:hypothetical protein XENTR_v10013365 [Xenopus tropicalis]